MAASPLGFFDLDYAKQKAAAKPAGSARGPWGLMEIIYAPFAASLKGDIFIYKVY
jgi:hypothetical protein